jgi:CheY-like chemotaxis protein
MDDTSTTLLVAERDEATRAFLLENLAADGYEPLGAQTEAETRLKLRNHGPALLVLGRFGEERQTLPLLRAIRSGEAGSDPTVPVIVLGDRDWELELLRAFEAGCDYFVPGRSRTSSFARANARVCTGHGVAGAPAARGGGARGRPRRGLATTSSGHPLALLVGPSRGSTGGWSALQCDDARLPLLRQPHGLEGLLGIVVRLDTHDQSVAKMW